MQDGKIAAFGLHSELIATNDHYRFVISSLDAAGNQISVEDEVK
jgi:ATP-binding cassette subfamily B protein